MRQFFCNEIAPTIWRVKVVRDGVPAEELSLASVANAAQRVAFNAIVDATEFGSAVSQATRIQAEIDACDKEHAAKRAALVAELNALPGNRGS